MGCPVSVRVYPYLPVSGCNRRHIKNCRKIEASVCKLFLWGYHPGFYRSEEDGEHSQYKYFTDFIAAVKEFRANK